MIASNQLTPVQEVLHPRLSDNRIRLLVKREDLVHPLISGNKWHKLKYVIADAKQAGFRKLVSFGGAYSNHLHALAFAGLKEQLETVGIVRGELTEPLNPTLQDAADWGMKLISVSRADYRQRGENDFVRSLIPDVDSCYFIPEGGACPLAIKGCADLACNIERQIPALDYLCVPCGTGATLAGLINGLGASKQLLGFSVLRDKGSIKRTVDQLLTSAGCGSPDNWDIETRFHFGGYAKLKDELLDFMQRWTEFSDIPLEPIYTGKMFYGIFSLVEEGAFKPGSTIVAVHTGGLQGLRGIKGKM